MTIKRLLAALAATACAGGTAYAADIPPAPEPDSANFVRACDAFGPGYFYIPGTDTCLRIGGYVRSEVQGGDQLYARQSGNRHRNTYAWLSRATLQFSTASETDLGTLRSFMELRSDWAAGADYGSASDDVGGSLRFAYIELGGLRVGLDETAFAHWTGYYGNVMNDDILDPASTRTNTISYTFNAKNGFSAMLGLEQGNNYSDHSDGSPDDLDDNIIGSDSRGYRWENGRWKRRNLSQQMHNYAPNVVGGLKYAQDWGGISTVIGYDSYYGSWAGKLRGDFNLSEKFSVFLMGGYKSMDDYYATDTTYGKNGIKTFTRADGSTYQKRGIYRQVNSIYGDWGGHWAAWTGATYKFRPQTSVNFQAAYNEQRTFATSANISHDIVPGLNVTPEVAYISWNDKYGHQRTYKGDAVVNSLKGKDAVQGTLRLTRSF